MIRVYQFGALAPTEGEVRIRTQMRAAHEYRNDLVAIERGRRSAVRAIHDVPAVREARDLLSEATKSDRRERSIALMRARRAAEANASDEYARIKELDGSIRRDARALTECYWGTYLGIEAAADQSRKLDLYERDGLTPADPKFVRGPKWRDAFDASDPRGAWCLEENQLGVQLQGGLSTANALTGEDTRVRLILGHARTHGRKGYSKYGTLWLRIGSDGREPIWGKWPIKLHRAIPDNAMWKWVRVSLRREGMRERWSVEITLDIDATPARELDTALSGAVAVELEWSPLGDEGIRVASFLSSDGETGSLVLPPRLVAAIAKPSGIRAVRDLLLGDQRDDEGEMLLSGLRTRLSRAIRESTDRRPAWLVEAGAQMHLWKSPQRFLALAMRWRHEKCDAARGAYEILQAWEARELHLYEYESTVRGQSLRSRRELYRTWAVKLAARFRSVLLPDRDLSREARWGDESAVRFAAAPAELAAALRSAFGADVQKYPWREELSEHDERDWCQRAIERWRVGEMPVAARRGKKRKDSDASTGNAWEARKLRKTQREAENEATRKSASNVAQ